VNTQFNKKTNDEAKRPFTVAALQLKQLRGK
jgi:hypothetical protein